MLDIQPRWLGQVGSDPADDPDELDTLAEVSVSVGDLSLSMISDPTTGEVAAGPRLPMIVLAEGLVRNWWPLLYEPQRIQERQPRPDENFEARHRLDSATAGYVFPPVGLWSGGEAVRVGLFAPDVRFQRQTFLLPSTPSVPWSLVRGDVEGMLGRLIEATLDRAGSQTSAASNLREGWSRIVNSVHDPEEKEWCVNAGRLGMDPYDPDLVDLDRMAAGIPDALFGDICEASEYSELGYTCEWVRGLLSRLRQQKSISIKGFGGPPYRYLSEPGWKNGLEAVSHLRNRLGLPLEPKAALEKLFGGGDQGREIYGANASAIEGIARRQGTDLELSVPARSARQQRFRMCRATYLAWRAGPESVVAATPADTWRQAASRAFAAELLAPGQLLVQRVGRNVLTAYAIERLADEWQCPPQAIVHQAGHHGLKVTGAETAAYY